MNSSFSTLLASLLEMLSDILDMTEQLHTASIEYTVLRHEGLPCGLKVTIQCLLAEQKPMITPKELHDIVKKRVKDKKTVTTNC